MSNRGPEPTDADPTPEGRSGGAASAQPGTDRLRVRITWYIVASGVALGIGGAAAVALSGGTGSSGLAVLLLLGAAGSAIAALYAMVSVAVDELRGRVTSWRRPTIAAGLFAAAAGMMAMVAGIGG